MTFQKGRSGNPSGRPRMPREVRAAIQKNGEVAVKRMADILFDDTAWGPNGWLAPKEQILLTSYAQDRAFGKAGLISIGPIPVASSDGASAPERWRRLAALVPSN